MKKISSGEFFLIFIIITSFFQALNYILGVHIGIIWIVLTILSIIKGILLFTLLKKKDIIYYYLYSIIYIVFIIISTINSKVEEIGIYFLIIIWVFLVLYITYKAYKQISKKK